MTRIKHTRDRESHYRFGDVEFPAGEREIEVDDDTAADLVERDDVEYADEDTDSETVEIEATDDEDEE